MPLYLVQGFLKFVMFLVFLEHFQSKKTQASQPLLNPPPGDEKLQLGLRTRTTSRTSLSVSLN